MSSATPAPTPDVVVQLVQRQVELYRRLQRLAERQRELVRHDDAQPLLALLAERRQIIDRLGAVSGELAPIQADWSAHQERLNDVQRTVVARLLDEASAILQSVLNADAEDARNLAARKSVTGNELQRVGTGRLALAAYQQTRPQPSRLVATDESA